MNVTSSLTLTATHDARHSVGGETDIVAISLSEKLLYELL
jgi:hypothetical protein